MGLRMQPMVPKSMSTSKSMDRDTPSAVELPGSVSTVLLAGPPTSARREVSATLLEQHPDADIVFVTYTEPPVDALTRATTASGDRERAVTVMAVGDSASTQMEDSVQVQSVTAPGDLTALGIALGNAVDGSSVAISFESVTTTLQYVTFPAAFEFFHAITGRVRTAGGHLHVHINPAAHDDQLLASLSTLFDARIDVGDEVTVQVRPPLDNRNS